MIHEYCIPLFRLLASHIFCILSSGSCNVCWALKLCYLSKTSLAQSQRVRLTCSGSRFAPGNQYKTFRFGHEMPLRVCLLPDMSWRLSNSCFLVLLLHIWLYIYMKLGLFFKCLPSRSLHFWYLCNFLFINQKNFSFISLILGPDPGKK